MKYSSFYKVLFTAVLLVTASNTAFADRPASEEFRETVPVREVPQAVPQAIPVASGCFTRASVGQTVWFFGDEDNTTAPGAYFDFWCADAPLNYRVGIEGRHMDVGQNGVERFTEAPGEAVETTYIRIPFALEYYENLGDGFTGYLGIGPDIINIANDLNDTAVGFHIGSRVHYAFDDSWGVALEAGYMWNELTDDGQDINLDGFYVTPTLAYTF